MIPFVRNRQYIFKMYKKGPNKIEWYMLEQDNELLSHYENKDINTLNYGAGSWEYTEDKILVNKIYVDDEVRMLHKFIQKFRINSVVDIFIDILNHIEEDKEGEE